VKELSSSFLALHNVCRYLLLHHEERLPLHALYLITAPFALNFDRALYLSWKEKLEAFKVEGASNFYVATEGELLPLHEAKGIHAREKDFPSSFDEAFKKYCSSKEAERMEQEAQRVLSKSLIYVQAMEEDILWRALLSMKPLHCKNAKGVPKFFYKKEFILLPLTKEGGSPGLLYVDNAYTERKIEEGDFLVLSLFADFLNACMERALLHKQAQIETKQLLLMESLSRKLAFAKSFEDLWNIMDEELKEIIPFDVGYIIILEKEKASAHLLVTKEVSTNVVEEVKELVRKKVASLFPYKIRFEDKALERYSFLSKPSQRLLSHIFSPMCGEEKAEGFLLLCSIEHHFTKQDTLTLSSICAQVAQALENTRLHEEQRNAYIQIIASLAAAIEKKDPYTHGHSEKVAQYSRAIARKMGLSEEMVEQVHMAALLHDIGKIGIKDEVLLKKGTLSYKEYNSVKDHPQFGVSILEKLLFLSPLLPIILHHHEHWDGSGYPKGIKGEQIPLGARIIAVADAFEAMTSERSYRRALKKEEALRIIEKCSARFFDPKVVEAFLSIHH
jgi:putative nucleotidyltransferase with HDIG domain